MDFKIISEYQPPMGDRSLEAIRQLVEGVRRNETIKPYWV